MKIAFLTYSYPGRNAGLVYSVSDRIRVYQTMLQEVRIVKINFYDDKVLTLIKSILGVSARSKGRNVEVFEGVEYQNVWIRRGLFSSVTPWGWFDKFRLFKIVNNERYLSPGLLENLSEMLEGIDVIYAHWGYPNGRIAQFVSSSMKLPYCVLYHGSDINLFPALNAINSMYVKDVANKAFLNFVVSKAMISSKVFADCETVPLLSPNGVSDSLYFRGSKNLNSKVVTIAFAGSMNYVKRADKLAEILIGIASNLSGKVCFKIMGKGEYKTSILEKMKLAGVEFQYFGEVERNIVLRELQSSDLLLLPSRNEGLPLIILEALALGVTPIATRVGGLPALLGSEFLVPESESFVEDYVERVIEIVRDKRRPNFDISAYRWSHLMREELAEIEGKLYAGLNG